MTRAKVPTRCAPWWIGWPSGPDGVELPHGSVGFQLQVRRDAVERLHARFPAMGASDEARATTRPVASMTAALERGGEILPDSVLDDVALGVEFDWTITRPLARPDESSRRQSE